MNKVHELTLQLQMMINERNELRAILANYTNNDGNNRQNSEREELKMDHQKETSELEKFPKEISQDSSRSKELTKKTNSYRQPLRERTQMKEKVGMLREDNRKLQQEQIFLQKSCEETKRLCEEDLEKIYDLLTKQQQGHQRLEEQFQSLLKQRELFTQQKNLAIKLQHHFTESQTRFEHLQHEMKQTTAQEESLLQIRLLHQELMCQASEPPLSPIPTNHGIHTHLKRNDKARGIQRHLGGITFYTPGSRPPLKKPHPFSCEHSIEENINRSSEDPATI
ncbi:hypothetical protein U0070_007336 [Myodes glareolus]|uniref:Disks large homolog 5 N-terminal domain-containing protein n=1 Tax=Myodes glareolus TaxID=447135 RepID=A0AAW0GY47_MYOGA